MNSSSKNSRGKAASEPVKDDPIVPISETSSQSSQPVPRVVVVCPHCKATLRVRRVYLGIDVVCKQCGKVFTVPADADIQPLPPVGHTNTDVLGPSPQASGGAREQQSGGIDKALLDQLGQFIAGSNDLRLTHDKLQAEYDLLKADRDGISARLETVSAELNAIRADLGAIASADVSRLAREREELSELVQSLRGENQDLQTKKSNHEDLISQLEERVLELDPLRAKHDALSETVKLHEGDLRAVRDERETLVRNLSERSNELAAVLSELGQRKEQFEQLNTELAAACHEREQLSRQLEQCQNDLDLAQADVRRSSGDHQDAQKTVEELTKTLAERDLTIRTQNDQFDAETKKNRQALDLAERGHREEREKLTAKLAEHELAIRTQSDQHGAAIETHRQAVELAERNHSEERENLTSELAALRAQLAEHEMTVGARHDQHHAEIKSTRQALELAERNHVTERERLSRELALLRAELTEHEQTLRARQEQHDAEIESKHQALELAGRNHADERERLAAELDSFRARHHEFEQKLESQDALYKQLEERNQELVTAEATLKSGYDALLSAERLERQQLADEILALRANAEETSRVAEQLISPDLTTQAAPVASTDQLEAARVQAEELKFKLEQAEYLYRMMAETLDGIGIHIDLPIQLRDRVEAGF
jgi:chromosome segregation ATPase